jgi:Regulator of ribonuclease activity B
MRPYRPPIPSLRQLQEHFQRMVSCGFNITGPLVWTYSFTHWSESKLLAFRWKLEALGYKYISVDEVPPRHGEGAASLFRLRVERPGYQSPEMLLDHLAELCRLAAAASVDYDGWEAGRLRN